MFRPQTFKPQMFRPITFRPQMFRLKIHISNFTHYDLQTSNAQT